MFCPKTDNHEDYRTHMDKYISQAMEWFKQIDSEPEIYVVHSEEEKEGKTNSKTIEQFEEANSEHLKLLFSVNMINEGLHVDDISGVIMLRPTKSRIVYLQQLGRAISSTRQDKSIVFDLVNNYLENCVRQLYTEIQDMKGGKPTNSVELNGENARDDGENPNDKENINLDELIEIFKIEGIAKDFIEIEKEARAFAGNRMLANARAIKEWMERNGRETPPSRSASDLEELRLARALNKIKWNLINPYKRLETDEERASYREDHPELEEIMQIVNWIDRNNLPKYLIYAREIDDWMKKNNTVKPPSPTSKDAEENRLGNSLISIRKEMIKPYMQKTEEEKEQYRKTTNPYIDEIIAIVEKIDENNIPVFIINMRELGLWLKEKKEYPKQSSKEKKEKKLAFDFSKSRTRWLKMWYELPQEKRNMYLNTYPELNIALNAINHAEKIKKGKESNLEILKRIQLYMDKKGTTLPPSNTAKDEEGRKLGVRLSHIKGDIIKPYMELKTEEEKAEFRKKHPDIEEIVAIVAQIDENNIPIYLKNIREIDEWMEQRETTKSPDKRSEDEIEAKLGRTLRYIRQCVVKPYMEIDTEEERSEYRDAHPGLEETLAIVAKIDENYVPKPLKNLLDLQEYMKRNGRTQPPSGKTKDAEGKRLGTALSTIRHDIIKPYMELKTEEEKAEFRKKHPRFDDILEIVTSIDMQSRSENRRELAFLLKKDLEKRRELQEAKKLEAMYAQELSKRKGRGTQGE